MALVVIGLIVKGTSNNSTEFRIRFDDKCRNKSPCVFDLFVREAIPGPVYLYIYFKNFYLNHRNVMRSFSKDQLKGDEVAMDKVQSACGDVTRNKHAGVSKYFFNTSPVDPEGALNPCGILPSLFPSGRRSSADSLVLQAVDKAGAATKTYSLETSEINYKNLRGNKFKVSDGTKDKQWLNVEDRRPS